MVIRNLAIQAAGKPGLRKLVMSTPGFRDLAWRLVAGEDLSAGLAAVRALNPERITGSLNALGMHIVDEAEAKAGAEMAIAALRAIQAEGLESNVSIKLTGIGLDIDAQLCREHLVRILECAAEVGNFVRIDMEEAAYVQRTLAMFDEMEQQFGSQTVGIVIQSYLRNPPYDLGQLASRGSQIRLVKGGYREPGGVVLRERAEIDAAFRRDIETLVRQATTPAIATHDINAIAWSQAVQQRAGLSSSAFEFQMLYGVKRNLQLGLVRAGHPVRCYVPYGGNWLNWLLLAAHGTGHRLATRARRLRVRRGSHRP